MILNLTSFAGWKLTPYEKGMSIRIATSLVVDLRCPLAGLLHLEHPTKLDHFVSYIFFMSDIKLSSFFELLQIFLQLS
jgi:hypothetical protein